MCASGGGGGGRGSGCVKGNGVGKSGCVGGRERCEWMCRGERDVWREMEMWSGCVGR